MSTSAKTEAEPAALPDLMATGQMPAPQLHAAQPASTSAAKASQQQPAAPRVTSLSVVVPAKNESAGLPALLKELRQALDQHPAIRSEVLVIDDGSTDNTAELARSADARVISHPESLGNGAAVKRGIRESRMDWILLLDGDGQHPPENLTGMLAMAERYDMVVASRNGSGGAWHRNLANKIYNGLASYVTKKTIPDLTSGFRLMRADVVKGFVYLLPNTFSYPTTTTLAMLRAGYAVGFYPFKVRARQGKSHINLLSDGTRFLLIIMRISVFFAPLRVFMPMSLAMAMLGIGWYAYTYLTGGRFTNMAVMLLTQSTVIFGLGLISEQVAALRLQRSERDPLS